MSFTHSLSRVALSMLFLFVFAGVFTIATNITQAEDVAVQPTQEFCGNITTDTVWGGGSYFITCSITVSQNTILTIDPGTTVLFGVGASMRVDGTLEAVGAESLPIIFTSRDSTRSWNGMVIAENGTANLDYVTIEKTRRELPYYTYPHTTTSALSVLSSNVTIRNSIFRDNETAVTVGAGATMSSSTIRDNDEGLFVSAGAHIHDTDVTNNGNSGVTISGDSSPFLERVDITNNAGFGINIIDASTPITSDVRISGNSGYAVKAWPIAGIEQIRGVASGNGTDAIMIDRGSFGGLSGNKVWDGSALGVPIVVLGYPGAFDVAAGATLTITPGTVVKFGPAIVLNVKGTLIARGVGNDQKITFTSQDDGSRWFGISVADGGAATLDGVVIEKARHPAFFYGWDYYSEATAALSILSDNVTIKNSIIQDNDRGIFVSANADISYIDMVRNIDTGIVVSGTSTPHINNVHVSHGGVGIAIRDTAAPIITNVVLTDNAGNAITSWASANIEHVSGTASGNRFNGVVLNISGIIKDSIWDGIMLGMPILVEGSYQLGVSSNVTLTIRPGTTILFSRSSLQVGGKLIAEGTEQLPITFTSLDGTRSWNGITIAENGSASFDHVIIENTTRSLPYFSFPTQRVPALTISSSDVTVNNSVIRDNDAGILVDASAQPSIHGNDVYGNYDYQISYSGDLISGASSFSGNYWGANSLIPLSYPSLSGPTTCPALFDNSGMPISSSRENLVVVTHGWNDNTTGWVKDMQEEILLDIDSNKTTVVTFDWREGANTGILPPLDSNKAFNNASYYGACLAEQIGTLQALSDSSVHVHLIAHSAGANVIQTATDKLAEEYVGTPKSPSVHLTFLDPYIPSGLERFGDLGGLDGWAEQYTDTRSLVQFADLVLDIPLEAFSAFLDNTNHMPLPSIPDSNNHDVKALDPEPQGPLAEELIFPAWPSMYGNRVHIWPVNYYRYSIRGDLVNGFTVLDGFPLSQESLRVEKFSEDSIPPYTSITLSGNIVDSNTFTSDVYVSLLAGDNSDGEGILKTMYAVDGETVQHVYVEPFVISGSGTHRIVYFSVDRAGNVESDKYIEIHIGMNLSDTQTLPDVYGYVTLNNTTPEVVIFDPTQEVRVNVGGANNPAINVAHFVHDGVGVLPKINIFLRDDFFVTIPAQTTVTSSDPHWDGVISAPIIDSLTLPHVVIGEVVEIGFSGGKLSFDKAVELLFWDEADKNVGYTDSNGVFTEITNICVSADDEVAINADLVGPKEECKVNAGSNLVIWTKHFTTFVTYEEVSDAIAPTTTLAFAGDEGFAQYLSAVQVTLTATDTPDGSGVASTTYSLDNSTTWIDYVAPFEIATEGEHTILYRSVDLAGNLEETKSVTFTIVLDTVPPVTTLVTAGTGGPVWFRSDIGVMLTATDDKTGVASTTYSLDNGVTWLEYSVAFTLTGEGSHTVKYRSIDKVGNVEEIKTATFYIDLTAPEAKISASVLSKELLIVGKDTMGSTTVAKTVDGYTVTDEAGHITKLMFKKTWNGKVLTSAQLVGIQYDNAPVIKFPKTQLLYVWTPFKGISTLTNQTIHVNKSFTVNATYLKQLDRTIVTVAKDGKINNTKTYSGLKLVTLTTSNGVVGYEL